MIIRCQAVVLSSNGGDKMNEIIYNNKTFKKTSIDDYFISNDGEVFSLKTNKILKANTEHHGHQRIELKINGIPKKFFIHRLVYETWVGELKENMVIEHLDSNPKNNYYKNLKQSTQKENIKTCIEANRRIGNIKNVYLFDINKNLFYKFNSVQDLLKYFNLKGDSISKFKKSKQRMENYKIIDDKTTEGQSTIETIDFSLVKSNNGVEYFIGEIPIEEVRSI